ncbi:MAG: HD-GYP domain-containing protein [Deinococcales bacterium]
MASSEVRTRPARLVRVARIPALVLVPPAVLALGWALGAATPGLPFVAAFAVSAAGLWFGPAAGTLEGVYMAALLAPRFSALGLDPLGAAHIRWWTAALFFILLGLAAGLGSRSLRRRLAAERAQREELVRIHARSLTTFAGLVAERDQPTAHHCERVAANARTLARHHGLTGHRLDALYWAGLLHDLGKISTPASILLKEGPLTDEEYDVIKRHADKGAEVLLDISDRFHQIAEGVRSHHEKWDGSGYPAGLAGADIPLFGRLLAVADVFEAMTAPRPYRRALNPEAVLRHLRAESGTHFDPELVPLFETLYRRGLIRTHDDGLPLPADVDAGIATTGFWRDQGRGPRARAPVRALAGTD